MARLMVSFQGAEFAYDLRGDAVRVGSGSTCGLLLKDAAVGKEHLELRRMGTAWRLLDLESASGTRVNGLYVNKHDLKAGDVVSIGTAKLTFLADEGVVPAPMPMASASPAPLAAAPPWATAAPMPPQGYAPQAYAPPAPAYAPPAPPPSRKAAGGRRRDRDRYEDEDDDRRPSRDHRRGGGGNSALWVLALFFAVGAAVFVVIQFTRKDLKVDPNSELLKEAKALEARGDWEPLLAYEGRGDKSWPESFRQVQNAVERAKVKFAVVKEERAVAEADDFYANQIKAPRENSSIDSSALVLRCDDFITRWSKDPRIDDVNFIRISLTGEPSPAWTAAKGGTGAGKGFVSVSTLLSAAEAEAARRMARNQFVAAWNVYEMFLKRAGGSVMPEYQAEFRTSIAKKKLYVEQKAKDLFDKMEERAMMLDDKKRWEEEEALYKEARDTIALGENIKRCDDEIARLREKR